MVIKILIVDSDSLHSATCNLLMEKWACRSEIVPTGKEACRKIRAQKYDLVLLDLDLLDVKVDGLIPVMRKIQPGINIVVMTSHSSRQREARIREQKIMYYLIKPFDEVELNEIVVHIAKRNWQSK